MSEKVFNTNDQKSQELKKLSFPEFLELLDLLSITEEGVTMPDDGGGIFVMESDEGVTKFVSITKKFPELFDDDVNKALEEFQKKAHSIRKLTRFALAKFSGTYSADFFEWTKCPLRIDVEYKDKRPISLEEILEFVKQLPVQPTAVLRTIKGWHIFYITSDRVSANDKAFKSALEEFKDTLLSLKRKYQFIDAVSILYNVHTRYSDEIYLLSEPKPKEQLQEEFKKASVVYDEENKETYFVIPKDKVSPVLVEMVFNSCPILTTLEQEWENHDYHEWLVMAWKYCFFAHITGMKEKYKQEFIEKSLRWERGKPDLKRIEYQFEAEYKSMDVGEGYKIMGCRGISSKACRLSHLCEGCPHAEWEYDEQGEKTIKSNIFRKVIESLTVQGYKLDDKEGWWLYFEGEKPTPVCKWFVIEDIIHFRSPESEKSFIKIKTKEGTDYIDYKLTTGGNVDYSEFNTLEIMHTRRKEVKTLFETLIDKFKLTFGSRVLTRVGYYYEKDLGKWRTVIANKDRYKPEDINYFMYNTLDYDGYSYIPSVSGNFDVWKASFKEILRRGDPVLLEMIGFALSHLTAPYMQKKGFKKKGLNTLFFLRGSSGSGKTTRLKLTAALFGTPAVIDISETTITKIERGFGNYKTPLMLDEVKVDDDENRQKLKKLVYLVANRGMKSHSYGTFRPIDVPVVIAGEDKHLPIEQMLMEGEGLYRRALVLLLDDEHVKQYRNLVSFYISVLDRLEEHHGFAFKVLDFISANERIIRQKGEEFRGLTLLQDALFCVIFHKKNSKGGGMMKKALLSAVLLGAANLALADNGVAPIGATPASIGAGGLGIGLPMKPTDSLFKNPAWVSFYEGANLDITSRMSVLKRETKVDTINNNETYNFLFSNVGLTYQLSENVGLGLGVVSSSEAVGYLAAVSYKITDYIALGGAVSVSYISSSAGVGESDLSTYAAGAQFGVAYNRDDKYYGGLSYSFPSSVKYKGVVDTDNDGEEEDLKIMIPQSVALGVGVKPTENLKVGMEIGFINWADAKGFKHLQWKNQMVFSVGGEYKPTQKLSLRAGYNYGKNPIRGGVKDAATSSNRVPNLKLPLTDFGVALFNVLGFPSSTEHHITFGVGYNFTKNFGIDFAYQYGFGEKIRFTDSNRIVNVSSKNTQHVVAAGLNFKF